MTRVRIPAPALLLPRDWRGARLLGPVVLREVVESDLAVFFANQQDPAATEMAAFPPRDMEEFGAHWKRILADRTVTCRTVLVGGEVAGNIDSWQQGGLAQVGYWIGREFWGRGVATEALRLFLSQTGARPLYAHVAKHNAGSIRVLEKCGFVRCGEEKAVPIRGSTPVDEWTLRLDAKG